MFDDYVATSLAAQREQQIRASVRRRRVAACSPTKGERAGLTAWVAARVTPTPARPRALTKEKCA